MSLKMSTSFPIITAAEDEISEGSYDSDFSSDYSDIYFSSPSSMTSVPSSSATAMKSQRLTNNSGKTLKLSEFNLKISRPISEFISTFQLTIGNHLDTLQSTKTLDTADYLNFTTLKASTDFPQWISQLKKVSLECSNTVGNWFCTFLETNMIRVGRDVTIDQQDIIKKLFLLTIKCYVLETIENEDALKIVSNFFLQKQEQFYQNFNTLFMAIAKWCFYKKLNQSVLDIAQFVQPRPKSNSVETYFEECNKFSQYIKYMMEFNSGKYFKTQQLFTPSNENRESNEETNFNFFIPPEENFPINPLFEQFFTMLVLARSNSNNLVQELDECVKLLPGCESYQFSKLNQNQVLKKHLNTSYQLQDDTELVPSKISKKRFRKHVNHHLPPLSQLNESAANRRTNNYQHHPFNQPSPFSPHPQQLQYPSQGPPSLHAPSDLEGYSEPTQSWEMLPLESTSTKKCSFKRKDNPIYSFLCCRVFKGNGCTITGARYSLIISDVGSRFHKTYLMCSRQEAAKCVEMYIEEIDLWASDIHHAARRGSLVTKILTDDIPEFQLDHFQNYLRNKRIKHYVLNPQTPPENDIIHRLTHMISESTDSILEHANLPVSLFWGHAMLHATYIENRLPCGGSNHSKTPFELVTGEIPTFERWAPFGCLCLVPGQIPPSAFSSTSSFFTIDEEEDNQETQLHQDMKQLQIGHNQHEQQPSGIPALFLGIDANSSLINVLYLHNYSLDTAENVTFKKTTFPGFNGI